MKTGDRFWFRLRRARLSSARDIARKNLDTIHSELCRDLPESGWTYGNATSINPLLVALGPSPGNSPRRGDPQFVSRDPFALPTAGEPHPEVSYEAPRSYFDKVRTLARTFLDPDGSLGEDALALFGNMNLSTGASGSASLARIDMNFARWVLETERGFAGQRGVRGGG